MRRRWFTFWSVLLAAMAGCYHPAQGAFADRYECPVQKTKIREAGTRQYAVTGCETRAVYHCVGRVCDQISESDESMMSSSSSPPSAARGNGEVNRVRHRDGYEFFLVDVVPLIHGFRVVAGAAPSRAKEHILLEFHLDRRRLSEEPAECDVRLLVDLQRIAVDDPERRDTSRERVWRLKVPVETAVALVTSKQAAFRVCGGKWELNDDSRERLARLLTKARETVAWDETPRTVGKVARAPEGGWPTWSKLADMPAASKAIEHDASGLYERLKGSVYPVHVEAGQRRALGSAVAITKTTLMTNCHVVEGATVITVGSTDKLRAKVVKADPKTDRCALEITGGEVAPIPGVRAYSDLKVGERAYTIGSPEGFESTLGEGLVSGLREESGLHYVQTSAPISPGSSGGGLFDRHGNLLGITTLVYIGEGHAQALNFAIAADEFFRE